jgi:hypothetical protein
LFENKEVSEELLDGRNPFEFNKEKISEEYTKRIKQLEQAKVETESYLEKMVKESTKK